MQNKITQYCSFIFSLLVLVSCNSAIQETHLESDSTLAVRTETVTLGSINDVITVSGTIEGLTTVKLGFMVPGKIDFITCKEGRFVTKGQLISSLEPAIYSLAKQLADVKLNATTDEFNRLKLMHSAGSLSESDFSKIGFALQQTRLEQKIQVRNLNDTKLYSPINGVLLEKQAEIGEVISAGAPLFTVADIRKVIVSVFIPESELHSIYIGQTAIIDIAALGKSFTGRVTRVGAVADPASRTFTVKMEIENADLQIRPGMIAEARIAVNRQGKGILLPVECIIHGLDNQSYVYVLDKATAKAFKRKVILGDVVQSKIVIQSGLFVNETVVVAGQGMLTDGSSITVIK